MKRFYDVILAERVVDVYKKYKPQIGTQDMALTRLLSFAERYSNGAPLISNLEGNKKIQEINRAKIILENICEKHLQLNMLD
jgi:hypothetical protein